jgi:DNA-directed RNA polymerase sigma subunit (sigma70/sigma32)
MQTADVVDIERAHRSLDIVIKENLTQREQYIVCNHFGLAGDRLTNKAKTLKQIGQTLSLSKERVRQIELIALQQLRQCLSPEEFDLLTK